MTRGEQAGFTWPPVEAGGSGSAVAWDAHPAPAPITLDDLLGGRREPGRVRQALHEVERVWLGFGSRAVGERLRTSGWAPPPACWRCGGVVGAHEVDGEGCATCRPVRTPWDRFVRLGLYDGVLREAVLELKQTAWRRIGGELGAMMGRRLAIELDRLDIDRRRVVVTPIPTTHRRRLARGVDHTLVLARAAADAGGVRLARVLTREHRPRQTGLSASDRLKNVRKTFGLRRDLPPDAAVIVVLDDVRTTGATLGAACRALKGIGGDRRAGVWACVAAVGDDRRTPGTQEPGSLKTGVEEHACLD
ncbi:MAG: hypothetical protein R3B57_02050 [Phycisphaerales bacterium]